jgi:hypothetical protein
MPIDLYSVFKKVSDPSDINFAIISISSSFDGEITLFIACSSSTAPPSAS